MRNEGGGRKSEDGSQRTDDGRRVRGQRGDWRLTIVSHAEAQRTQRKGFVVKYKKEIGRDGGIKCRS